MTKAFSYVWCLALCFVGCSGQKSFKEMADEMAGNETPTVQIEAMDEASIILDCRSREEYAVSHIPNAIWVGEKLDSLPFMAKSAKVVVYCSVGYRSGKFGEKLQEVGYTDVKNLWGGIFRWINLKLPLVDHLNEPTNRIHPYNDRWGKWLEYGEKAYR